MYLSLRASYFFKALALCLLLLLGARKEGYGQRVLHFADMNPNSDDYYENPGALGGKAIISGEGNQITSDPYSFASMSVTSGLLVSSSAYINLKFSINIEAGTTVYVRLSSSTSGLLSALGGSLTVTPFNGSTELLSNQYAIVKDLYSLEGSSFWTIKATTSFNTIRVKIVSGILLDGGSINVHHAFYVTGKDACEAPLTTGIGSNGITLDLLGNGPRVINPIRAIDADQTNYSQLTLGTGVAIGVGNSVYQDVYFPSQSSNGDGFRIYLRSPQTVLNVSLFSGIKVTAFDSNGVAVFQNTLDQILGLDLLGLLGDKNLIPIDIYPNQPFSQIRVELGKVLNVDLLAGGLEFYGVRYIPPPPNMTNADDVQVCEGANAELAIPSPPINSYIQYNWYSEAGTLLGSGSSIIVSNDDLPLSNSPYTFFVTAQNENCPGEESAKVPIAVIVHPKPGKPNLNIIPQ